MGCGHANLGLSAYGLIVLLQRQLSVTFYYSIDFNLTGSECSVFVMPAAASFPRPSNCLYRSPGVGRATLGEPQKWGYAAPKSHPSNQECVCIHRTLSRGSTSFALCNTSVSSPVPNGPPVTNSVPGCTTPILNSPTSPSPTPGAIRPFYPYFVVGDPYAARYLFLGVGTGSAKPGSMPKLEVPQKSAPTKKEP